MKGEADVARWKAIDGVAIGEKAPVVVIVERRSTLDVNSFILTVNLRFKWLLYMCTNVIRKNDPMFKKVSSLIERRLLMIDFEDQKCLLRS